MTMTHMAAATAHGGKMGFIARMMRTMRQANERTRVRRTLLQLDDHLLRDIGLSRGQVWSGEF